MKIEELELSRMRLTSELTLIDLDQMPPGCTVDWKGTAIALAEDLRDLLDAVGYPSGHDHIISIPE